MLYKGQIVNNSYRILTEISKGSMSQVYLACEINKRELYVIKKSTKNEANILDRIDYPNIPKLVDVFDIQMDSYIVMEYIEGKSLLEVLKERRVETKEAKKIASLIAKILLYLHSLTPPVIYRDLKPSNIILKNDGTISLIDFGIAKEFIKNKPEEEIYAGTRGYAAPEQLDGIGCSDERTDIYSFGMTFYQLLTGQNPGEPPYEVYPITYWNEDLPKKIEKIILKCIEVEPQNRYADIKSLILDLDK